MPRSSAVLCARCGTQYVGKRCPRCASGWANGRKGKAWANFSTADPRWVAFRARYLAEHPMCEWPGCVDLSAEVDHIDGTDYDTQRFDANQVRALCIRHHRQRTTAQGNAAQGRGGGKGRPRR